MPPRRPPAVLVVLLLVAALLGTTAASADAAARPNKRQPAAARATWVWDRPDPAQLVDFARSNRAVDLFVSTPVSLATSPDLPWFTDLRSRATAAGLRLHALGAETWWIDDPQAALAWQRQALASGLFDGVHLDVEPWLHPAWNADRTALLERYVDLLALLAGDTTRPVEADIAFWLHELTVRGERLDEAVMRRVDAVTVMSYRDTATGTDGITGVAATALDAARRLGRPIRLAVETNDLGSDPVARKQTFYGETRRTLDQVLRAVDAAVGAQATYRGIAVHDVRGWSSMRR